MSEVRHAIFTESLSDELVHWICLDCPRGGLRPTAPEARAHAEASHAAVGITGLDTSPTPPPMAAF